MNHLNDDHTYSDVEDVLDSESVTEDPLLGSDFGVQYTGSTLREHEGDLVDQFNATKRLNETKDFGQQTMIYCPQSKYLTDLVGSHISVGAMDDLLRLVARMDSHVLFLEKKNSEDNIFRASERRVFDSLGLRSPFTTHNTNFNNTNNFNSDHYNYNHNNNNSSNRSSYVSNESEKTPQSSKSTKLLLDYAKELLASELEIEKLQNELSTLKDELAHCKRYHTGFTQQQTTPSPNYTSSYNYNANYPQNFTELDGQLTSNDLIYQQLMKKEDELLLYPSHSPTSPNRKHRQ
eukprot:TRINITY_DN1690_c0_g1_i1.p1 TRINITY_DN1690_c0_g1~~TRINITY_DN1690_c0_g1_i1.p1  ORF type:complete len:291 (+),score=69.44 TRINITY_DN1690_c0_g1_i1:223-1095(+)